MRTALVYRHAKIDPSLGGGGTTLCVLIKKVFPAMELYTHENEIGGRPDVVFYVAAFGRKVGRANIFLPTNCVVLKYKLMGMEIDDVRRNNEEDALKNCNLVLTENQYQLQNFVDEYPKYEDKLINGNIALLIEEDKYIPFEKRKYDFIGVATNWDRDIKNYNTILACAKALPKSRFVFIGSGFNEVKRAHNTIFYGSIPYKDLSEGMNKARVILIPSLYDSGPLVAWHAYRCGCNVLVSRNCGFVQETNDISVASIEKFPEKAMALTKASGLTTLKNSDQQIQDVAAKLREIVKCTLS